MLLPAAPTTDGIALIYPSDLTLAERPMETDGGFERVGAIFCGGGPAAIGPIVAAAGRGDSEELLDAGILVIEPHVVGPGGMAHYRIPANSLGGAFLECLDSLTDSVFLPLRDAEETRALRRYAEEYPPLSVVAAFLGRLGACVTELLERHPRCRVITGAEVTKVRLREDGDGAVVTAVRQDGTAVEFLGERVLLTMGGVPLPDFETVELAPGLSLEAHRDKVVHSEILVDRRKRVPAGFTEAVRETGRVVIVGGSHSAWSAADLLVNSPEAIGLAEPPQVTLLHRTALQLFYLSAADAEADGYPFDPVADVCAASGRVNRFGGLRGPARRLAQGALGMSGESARVRLIWVGGGVEERRAATRALDEAGAVVVATGYQTRLPELRGADGAPLSVQVSTTGTVVTRDTLLVMADGSTDPRLLAYGVGAGLPVFEEIGGEPGYTRRADGVWLYQNDIGNIVLDQLLPSPSGASRRSTHSTTTTRLTPR